MTRFSGFKKAARKLSELSSKFREAASRVSESVDEGTEETAEDISRTAKRLAPRGPSTRARRASAIAKSNASTRSGRLKRSIDYTQLEDGTWVIGSPLDYAEWVEKGRGPVRAKDAEALRFTINGRTVFADNVGPAEPQPFLRPALLRNRDNFTDNLEDELEIMFDDVFD